MKKIPLYEVRPISNLKEMLNSSVELYSDKAAFLSKRKGAEGYYPITYSQFGADVNAFGTVLASMGLMGSRIAVIGENKYEWSITYLSVVNGIGIIVPIDKELPQNEMESLLTRAHVTAVISAGSKREDISALMPRLDFVKYFIDMDLENDSEGFFSFHQLLEKGREMLLGGDKTFIDSPIDNEALSIILFTSATTDKSKAVMLSHKNICSNLMAMCSMTYIDHNDTFLSILPIHHTYECTCGFLCPLYRGATVAYCEGLRHIPKNLQESKATVLLGVPLIFEAMYKRIWDQAAKSGADKKLRLALKISAFLRKLGIDLRKKLFAQVLEGFGGEIKLLISGAAAIEPSVSKGFRELGMNFLQGYGLTECSPIVALNRDCDYVDDAAGLPLPNLDLKIDNPNYEGVGEITVKGPSVMMGYYEDEEATKKAFEGGVFHTGDLGYFDSQGFVHITGRKKNVIVTKNGKNIYPEEIETLLNKSPYILESLVFGKDDDVFGDVVVSAIIVPDVEKIKTEFGDGQTADQIRDLIHQEVKAINKKLVTYKYIKDFTIRDTEFEKTTSKKIKRYAEKIN